jgi:glycosyltransferase involved in cell wall biosynthesis
LDFKSLGVTYSMHWTVAVPSTLKQNHPKQTSFVELPNHVPGKHHQFTVIYRKEGLIKWHDRASSVTGFKDWLQYWEQAKKAVESTEGGVITVFPQLPATVAMYKVLKLKRTPIVAWLFNVGTCYSGMRQHLAQLSLNHVARFMVPTRREQEIYHQWLGLPRERFVFVPFHDEDIPVTYEEETENPFLVALGSAHRDFATLFKAVEYVNLPTVVASGKRALEGLTIPPLVKTPFGISRDECLKLAQQARISIVPMVSQDHITAAGQVTIVEAMKMRRAVIATRCNGAEDYIIHGETGILVEPNSVEALADAIKLLWEDTDLRNRIGQAAGRYADAHFSNEAAGVALGKILDSVVDEAKR